MTAYPNLQGSLTLPRIVTHAAQPVLVRHAAISMDQLDTAGPAALDAVANWMAAQGIAPTGPGFFRYDLINMAGRMGMAFGYPVAPGAGGKGDIVAETLPAGRYVSVLHHGHPDELYDATIMLIEWAKVRQVDWDVEETAAGARFAARLELFNQADGDPSDDWLTEIRIRLRD
jgi:effector-binding domain-containing protein